MARREPDPPDLLATIRYAIVVDVVPLGGKPATESVVAVLGVENELRRIAFGRLTNGRFECQWDSPIIGGRDLEVGYSDLDGDGWKEIIVSSEEGMKLPWRSFVAFSHTGQELTRESVCDSGATRGYSDGAAACPLMGRSFEIRAVKGSRAKEIISTGSVEDDEARFEHTYRFVKGRYVEQPPR